MSLQENVFNINPTARSWYASRGLPYRRGYLLYGRPGTGKSSLSMSVAGCFGLDIYVLSLAGINDGRLSTLFAELPQRCVVLLEDVDAVGTTQSRDAESDESDSGSEESRSSSKPRGTLSLSGVLNVLDGVASQEGRVLIMTTNHIEHLDDALIRPGLCEGSGWQGVQAPRCKYQQRVILCRNRPELGERLQHCTVLRNAGGSDNVVNASSG